MVNVSNSMSNDYVCLFACRVVLNDVGGAVCGKGYKYQIIPPIVHINAVQGRNHFFKFAGFNSLFWGITTLLQKEIRPVYPVWCSRLHNHILFIKNLRKKLWG